MTEYTETIGTVVGSTSPLEYQFHLKRFTAKLGDLVTVNIEIPSERAGDKEEVCVWGRITSLKRFNPFLPTEATVELADEGLELTDTVLSNTRDQVEGSVLVLGRTSERDFRILMPLNYPVQPGALVKLPLPADIKTILTGDDQSAERLQIGTLLGRRDVDVSLKTNVLVARHMAILAMTGGGKTVAARRIIKELLGKKYPVVILDPHGDYLGFWTKQDSFPSNKIKLYYPNIDVNDQNKHLISYLLNQMTQGLSDPQKEVLSNAMDQDSNREGEGIPIDRFISELIQKLGHSEKGYGGHKGTIPAVKRGLRIVKRQMEGMVKSNENLRHRLQKFPFEPMPDPYTRPEEFVCPGQLSVIYLGGYDHLTQSTIASIVLEKLFEERASMQDSIPPFLTVVEEAHNFIPSRGEGQSETPSVEIIRKVITEGRKFGVGLLLISQRPNRLDETTLSQCNTFLVFRLVNPRDQNFVERVMENLSKPDSRLLPGFGPGEGIISGQAIRFPLIVRIKEDSELYVEALGNEDFVSRVAQWENSPQSQAVQRGRDLDNELKNVEE